MRDGAGQFVKGVSGNPAGRPPKIKGRLSFQLPLVDDPASSDLSRAVMKLTVEAAAGKRTLSEAECMIRILRQAMGTKNELERHEIDCRNSLIQGMETMLDHIHKQTELLRTDKDAETLMGLISQAQAELDLFVSANNLPPFSAQ